MNASLHGELIFDVLVAFALAALVALPLLIALRASMQHYMRTRRSAVYTPPAAPPRPHASSLRVEFAELGEQPRSADGRELALRARTARRAGMFVYGLAGFAAALLLTYADLLDAGPEARAKKFAVLFALHAWPLVIAVASLSLTAFRTKVWALPLIAALLLAFTAALTHSAMPWLVFSGPPTLLLLLTANRRSKTIAPVLAIVAFVAALLAHRLLNAYIGFGVRLPLAAKLVIALSIVVAIVLALLLVMLLAMLYRWKVFGDTGFQQAFVWATFCVWYALSNGRNALWPYGLAAFVLWGAIATFGNLFVRAYVRRRYPASLLVLRVFGAPSHAQTLFENLGARWRTAGPLQLVAGTDSAIANLDIDEALRYLTFRFRSLFVADAADLERRLQRLDMAPDPDGRYRTNDFFCFDDTWKATFTRLLERSYAVMLDLGGFGVQNAGVAFELGQLLARRPLDSFVLVTGDDTDFQHLYAKMGELWSRLDPAAPNAGIASPVVRMLHKPSPRELVAALCDAAVAGGWKPVARLQS